MVVKADKAKKPRTSLSRSPLARPDALIHMLAGKVQEFIHFPVPDPLYVLLGAVASNMMKGDPVWMMLIGPPSSGKTILVRSLRDLPKTRDLSSLSGKSAFLSAVPKKEMQKGAAGGLLREMGSRGMILLEDFTSSVMDALSFETRKEVLDAFRLIYNGYWSRSAGSDGGKTMVWTGKIALIAGATPEIDRLSSAATALGERWLYYRFEDSDGYGESRKSGQDEDPDVSRGQIREWVAGFFEGIGLTWGCPHDCELNHECSKEEDRRQLTDMEAHRVFAMASLVAKIRGAVPRDPRTHEVVDIARAEMPTRLNNQLGQLYRGLERIGLGEEESWRCLGKVAMDSTPQLKLALVMKLLEAGGINGVKPGWLKQRMKCSIGTVVRSLEDLVLHGVVEWVAKEGKEIVEDDAGVVKGMYQVRLTRWAVEQIRVGWGWKEGLRK